MDIIQKKLKKNIVILGAGFAGVRCALKLEKIAKKDKDFFKKYNIVLIDKNSFHLYTPALYEVATTAKADASGVVLKKIITTDFSDIIKNKNIKFIQGEIKNVNLQKKIVKFTDQTSISFEYLVFALGSEPSYFNIDGLKEYSHTLKWLRDGIKIRNNIRREFLLKNKNDTLKIVIGGSGPNGIEFASELKGYIKELNKIYNTNIKSEILLIDGAPHILPGFEHNIVKKAKNRLNKLEINSLNGYIIHGVTEKNIYLRELPKPNQPQENFKPKKKTESYDILIWSGGVKANCLTEKIDIPKEKRGRIEIGPILKCNSPDSHMDISDKMFAIGDNCCFLDPETERPIPQTARVAIKQANIAAQNIYNNIKNRPKILFKYKPGPFSIPMGGKWAITKVGPFVFSGFLGWLFKQFVELYYLYSITDKASIVFKWLYGLRIFSKND